MAFKPVCPKCGSAAVTFTRERSGFGPLEGTPVMSCRCGTRIYGATAVEAEYMRQRRAWKEPVAAAPKPVAR